MPQTYLGVEATVPVYGDLVTINITSDNIADEFTVTNGTYYFVGANGVFTSNNKGLKSSTAITTLTALKDMDIAFSYSYSSEDSYDKFTLTVADVTVENGVSGATTIKSYTGSLTSGQSVVFKYVKDSSSNSNDDQCTFYNMTVARKEQIGTTKRPIAHTVKNMYVGVNGLAKKIRRGYIGVNGTARLFFESNMNVALHGQVDNPNLIWFQDNNIPPSQKLVIGDYAALLGYQYLAASQTERTYLLSEAYDYSNLVRLYSKNFVITDIPVTYDGILQDSTYMDNNIIAFDEDSDGLVVWTMGKSLVQSTILNLSSSRFFDFVYHSPNYVFCHADPAADSRAIDKNLTLLNIAAPTLDCSSNAPGYLPNALLICGGYDDDGDAVATFDVYDDNMVKQTSSTMFDKFRYDYTGETACTSHCMFFPYTYNNRGTMMIDSNLVSSQVTTMQYGENDLRYSIDLGDYIIVTGTESGYGASDYAIFDSRTATARVEALGGTIYDRPQLTSSKYIAVQANSTRSGVRRTISFGFTLE